MPGCTLVDMWQNEAIYPSSGGRLLPSRSGRGSSLVFATYSGNDGDREKDSVTDKLPPELDVHMAGCDGEWVVNTITDRSPSELNIDMAGSEGDWRMDRVTDRLPSELNIDRAVTGSNRPTDTVREKETAASVIWKVMTFNIHHGADAGNNLSLERIITTIQAVEPDIVALQEVDRNFGWRSQFQDQAQILAEQLGMDYAYGIALQVWHALGRGFYGNMVLSRYPIIESKTVRLPTPLGREPRSAVKAVVASPEGQIAVWSTHLSLSSKTRQQQVAYLLAAIEQDGLPALVLGDFNALPHSPEIRQMAARLQDVAAVYNRQDGTFHSDAVPAPRIDYIWLTGGWRALDYDVIRCEASDHMPVVAKVSISLAGKQYLETGGNITRENEFDS